MFGLKRLFRKILGSSFGRGFRDGSLFFVQLVDQGQVRFRFGMCLKRLLGGEARGVQGLGFGLDGRLRVFGEGLVLDGLEEVNLAGKLVGSLAGSRRFRHFVQRLLFVQFVHDRFRNGWSNGPYRIAGAETGGNDGHLNGVAQLLVLADAHDDVHLTARLVLDVVVDLANFVKGDFMLATARNNQQQHMARPLNVVVVEQGRIQGLLDGVHGTFGPARLGRTHNGRAGIVQDRTRIAQVNVDVVVVRDDLGNALGSGGQHFVCFVEAGLEPEVAVDFTQFVVVDDDERIDLLFEFFNARFGLTLAQTAFKSKRSRHNAHG